MTNVSLKISITKDNISESNEIFYLSIEEHLLPSKITTDGAISQAKVIVTNNYGKLVLSTYFSAYVHMLHAWNRLFLNNKILFYCVE